MMKTTAAPLAAAVLLAGALAASSSAQAASVEVVNPQSAASAGTDKVEVLRGEPVAVPKSPPPYQLLGMTKSLSPDIEMVGGKRLWFVDKTGDRLMACELRKTTQVSGRVIRCRSRELPRRLKGL